MKPFASVVMGKMTTIARVHWSGDDAAPLLPFQVFIATDAEPRLATLPDEAACSMLDKMVEAQRIE